MMKKSLLKKVYILIQIAVLLSVSFSIISCSRNHGEEIVLDNSDPLSLAPDIRWAVIKEPYAAFREETSWDSRAIDHCRNGDIFPINASSTVVKDGKTEIWYRFENGWLPASVLNVYQNKFKAQKASHLSKEN